MKKNNTNPNLEVIERSNLNYADDIQKECESKTKEETKDIKKELDSLKNVKFKDFNDIMADYHSGDEKRVMQAKEDACANLKGFIVYMIMRNFWTYCHNYFQDMLQCGYIGVMKGMDAYDPSRTMPTTFFKTYIKCEITRFITEFLNGSTVHYATTLGKINKAKRYFESLNIEYNDTTLAEYLGISLVSVKEALASQEAAISVNYQDEFAGVADDSPYIAKNAAFKSPEEELEEQDLIDVLSEAMQKLTNEEREAISMRFGLEGSPMSIRQIANELEIAQGTVKLYIQRALTKLRTSKLREMYDDKYKSPAWLEEIDFFPEAEEDVPVVAFTIDDLISDDELVKAASGM